MMKCIHSKIFDKQTPKGLTEHHLQTHKAGHKVIKVKSHVCLGVTCYQQLKYTVIETET